LSGDERSELNFIARTKSTITSVNSEVFNFQFIFNPKTIILKLMNKTNQHGFHIWLITLIVVVLAGLGFAGWYVWDKNQNQTTDEQTSTTPTTSNSLNLEPYDGGIIELEHTYADAELPVSFSYPAGWRVTAGEGINSDANNPLRDISILSSDDSFTIYINEWSYAKGYNCEPKTTDVPFAIGNECGSMEVVSADPTGAYVYDENGEQYTVMLTTRQYSESEATIEGPTSFQICLEAENDKYPIETSVPSMPYGHMPVLLMPTGTTTYDSGGNEIGYGLYLCSSNISDSEFFESRWGEEIKAILSSVRFN
jgi:hypothetical protein